MRSKDNGRRRLEVMSPERVVFMSPPMLGTYALLKTVNFTRPWLKLAFFRTRNIKFHNCFHCIHSMCVGGGGQFFSVKNDKNPQKSVKLTIKNPFPPFPFSFSDQAAVSARKDKCACSQLVLQSGNSNWRQHANY